MNDSSTTTLRQRPAGIAGNPPDPPKRHYPSRLAVRTLSVGAAFGTQTRTVVGWIVVGATMLWGFAGCTTVGVQPNPTSATSSDRNPGTLEVLLEFDDRADLDLFVTGPDAETVYFGNNPSRGGGVLNADRRCDAPAPRIERVSFGTPKRGRYRVGVEYNRSCRWRREATNYRIEVRADSLGLDHEGTILPGRFEHIAFEFSFDG